MKTTKSLATLTLCMFSVFGTSVVLNTQQAKAQEERGRVCSNRSLHGAYEVQGAGYVNNTEPFAVTALDTFDGDGKIEGSVQAISTAGNVKTDLPSRGTYQVNRDCSLTASFIRADGTTANYSGVVYDNGNKFGYTETDTGSIVNVKGERVKKYERVKEY